MEILRFDCKTISVSDLAVEIACELYNKQMLNKEYVSVLQYDDMSEKQKHIFLVEEVSIIIDKILS